MDEFHIEYSHEQAVLYAESLMKKHREELGFLPRTALEQHWQQGALSVGVLNGEPCGYVVFSPPRPFGDVRLYQICLPKEVRRRLFGAQIMADVELRCRAKNATGIWHKTAFEIEANEFWEAIGFYCSGIIHGGYKRNRILNVYRKDFLTPLITTVRPSVRGEKDMSRYNKMRSSGKLLLPFGYKQEELVEW